MEPLYQLFHREMEKYDNYAPLHFGFTEFQI